MGTAANILQDWASSSNEKIALYSEQPSKLIRWLNEGQLIFSEKSECLRDVWQPTITSSGVIALPSNFKREIKDRIKYSDNIFLRQIDYPTAKIYANSFGGTYWYSIWGNNFYVWSPSACNPIIPIIAKPTILTSSTLPSADLEISTEYHHYLFTYFDSQFAREKGDDKTATTLFDKFVQYAEQTYIDVIQDNDVVPKVRGTFF